MLQSVNSNIESNDETSLQYMRLSLGDSYLLVNQSDIYSIESIKGINTEAPTDFSIGSIYVKEKKILVYSLSNQLEFEHSIDINKTICTVLSKGNILIGLACVEITPFNHRLIRLHSLPECMKASSSPVESLCLYKKDNDSDISFVVSTNSLARFIDDQNV